MVVCLKHICSFFVFSVLCSIAVCFRILKIFHVTFCDFYLSFKKLNLAKSLLFMAIICIQTEWDDCPCAILVSSSQILGCFVFVQYLFLIGNAIDLRRNGFDWVGNTISWINCLQFVWQEIPYWGWARIQNFALLSSKILQNRLSCQVCLVPSSDSDCSLLL